MQHHVRQGTHSRANTSGWQLFTVEIPMKKGMEFGSFHPFPRPRLGTRKELQAWTGLDWTHSLMSCDEIWAEWVKTIRTLCISKRHAPRGARESQGVYTQSMWQDFPIFGQLIQYQDVSIGVHIIDPSSLHVFHQGSLLAQVSEDSCFVWNVWKEHHWLMVLPILRLLSAGKLETYGTTALTCINWHRSSVEDCDSSWWNVCSRCSGHMHRPSSHSNRSVPRTTFAVRWTCAPVRHELNAWQMLKNVENTGLNSTQRSQDSNFPNDKRMNAFEPLMKTTSTTNLKLTWSEAQAPQSKNFRSHSWAVRPTVDDRFYLGGLGCLSSGHAGGQINKIRSETVKPRKVDASLHTQKWSPFCFAMVCKLLPRCRLIFSHLIS